MHYTVKQLADLAGVTPRALRHYDRIGLLRPSHHTEGGYRCYGEKELLRLQQILFFRELGIPLKQISTFLESDGFELQAALAGQRSILVTEMERLRQLIHTIDRTVARLKGDQTMPDDALYNGFSKAERVAYAAEAKARWGHTDAYKQSVERARTWTAAECKEIEAEFDQFFRGFADLIDQPTDAPPVQALVSEYHKGMHRFYDCTCDIFRGLAQLYVADERFAATFRKYDERLPDFLSRAMIHYCDTGIEGQ